MKRILGIALILCCALPGIAADTAAEGMKGALQVGIGAANVTGGPDLGLSYQVFTLQAAGLLFPSPWAAVIADFSYGLPHTYEYKNYGNRVEIKVQASYLDGLLGVYKVFSDGGFVYLGAGVTVGFGGFDVKDNGVSTDDFDIKTSIGFACGAGLALPITDRMSGFVNLRQRFIKNELEITDDSEIRSYDMSSGGTEVTVGLSWTFGG